MSSDKFKTTLSLAVLPVDDYTSQKPIGDVNIFIKELGSKGILNDSGYYLFFGLSDNNVYSLVIKSTYYFQSTTTIKPSDLKKKDSSEPVVEIVLSPLPSYPFPTFATLIRGTVTSKKRNDPISDAQVSLVGKEEIKNITTVNGDFVLFFKNLTDSDIIKDGTKKLIKVNNDTNLSLKITHSDYNNAETKVKVEEGATVSVPVVLERSKS